MYGLMGVPKTKLLGVHLGDLGMGGRRSQKESKLLFWRNSVADPNGTCHYLLGFHRARERRPSVSFYGSLAEALPQRQKCG